MPLAPQLARDARETQRVLGDDLADPAVAAGGRRRQHAVLVAKADREPVDLELAEPVHGTARRRLGLDRPVTELVGREDVVEAQHPLGVLDRGEIGRPGRAHRERRAVLTLQLGERPLDRLEPVHPPVVGGVVDKLGIAPVVRLARVDDALRQVGRLGARLVEGQVGKLVVLGHRPSLGRASDIARGPCGAGITPRRVPPTPYGRS